ncbi:hypothetical protein [Halobacillus karajensis]|uniref:hypothetical protein n=1 Tax=Halobacillus karajensis TaxID=195088 RepID=UPI00045CF471|nr:hypothetical protein [Halobacillus karajensis]CDQ17964.1 hypothetical protein BN982_00204 [Halobacillus karajensis]
MQEDMECKHRQVEILVEENKRLKKALKLNVSDYESSSKTLNHTEAMNLSKKMAKRSLNALEVAR